MFKPDPKKSTQKKKWQSFSDSAKNKFGKNPRANSRDNFPKQAFRPFKKAYAKPQQDFPELSGGPNASFEPEFKQTRTPQAGDFQSLFQIAANRFGLGPTVKAIQICQEARYLIKENFPKSTPDQIAPLLYKDGTLIIKTSSSSQSQLVVTKKHLILEALNKKFGAKTCQEIKVRLAENQEI